MDSIEVILPLTTYPSSSSLSSWDAGPSTSIASSSYAQGRRRTSRFSISILTLLLKITYRQCFSAIAIFFFSVFVIQLFYLPADERRDGRFFGRRSGLFKKNDGLSFLEGLDFGDDLRLEPFRVSGTFRKNPIVANGSVGSRTVTRYGYRQPRIALVFADLEVDSHQIQMATVAIALEHIGYQIEVFASEDGPARPIWRELAFPVNILTADKDMKFNVDWLNYNGVLVNSPKAVGILSFFMQEPFKDIPLVWTIHDQTLATRLKQHASSGQNELIENWRNIFSRPDVIVFPDIILPIVHSICDPGNYYVIPGSPHEVWKSDKSMVAFKHSWRSKMDYGPDDFVIAVVGSQLVYSGLWLEHGFVLKALYPLLTTRFNNSSSQLRIIVLAGDSTITYCKAVEIVAWKLGYQNSTVKCIAANEDADNALSTAHVVIYGSFLEEHTFPGTLLKAMRFEKPVIAPDLLMTRKYVVDGENGYLFLKEDVKSLTEIMLKMVSAGKLSLLGHEIALRGKRAAKNFMVSESVEGYASLLENILMIPSEVSVPQAVQEIPAVLKSEWLWDIFEALDEPDPPSEDSGEIFEEIEKEFNATHKELENALDFLTADDAVLDAVWEEQKDLDTSAREEGVQVEEINDRNDQTEGTWDQVYRNVRRADLSLHERDGGELERTGQPLCIYEPYAGEGTWPFLHHTSLYRGIRQSTSGRRRPGADDVNALSRLPLLNDSYYRDALGEFGAFFAVANRSDRLHKNAWIGFQSWRATARKVSLTKIAERSLVDAIEAQRHGDALYFWASLDMDPRTPLVLDFWSFCDTISAGNCRFAFSEAMKTMYGVKRNLTSLPPMPKEEGTFSVSHCWIMPTRSFMEFVMFSRMFVDALDAQFYEDHRKTGLCYLRLTDDKSCYSGILELVVNVWAYHSGRRLVYVEPETGYMKEQHPVDGRRGGMWVKWFEPSTLKSMDEDLADEFDSEKPERHWLWPSTGEVFWKGIQEKEKLTKHKEKAKRLKLRKERLKRMKKEHFQKPLGESSEDEPNPANLQFGM